MIDELWQNWRQQTFGEGALAECTDKLKDGKKGAFLTFDLTIRITYAHTRVGIINHVGYVAVDHMTITRLPAMSCDLPRH